MFQKLTPKIQDTVAQKEHLKFLAHLVLPKISFGGIPNSSNIDILMPYAIFDYIGIFLRSGFAHVDNVIPVIKTITWLLLSRLQGTEPTPAYTGTLRNLPEPSGTCLRNLRHFTPELSGTFRNLPPELTPFYKGTLRNLPEPASGTYTSTLRNSPEPSGTPEPAPATRTGTHRSLSGLKTPLAYAVGEKISASKPTWTGRLHWDIAPHPSSAAQPF